MSIARTPQELRKFGLIMLGYFIFFSLLFYSPTVLFTANNLIILSILLCASLFIPSLLLPFSIVFYSILKVLSWINLRLLLGFIFFLIFSPISTWRNWRKKNVLNLSFNQKATTYRISTTDSNDIRKPY